MQKNKIILSIIIISILLLPLIIHLTNIKLVFFDTNFHKDKLIETGSYGKFNNTEEVHNKLINYYKFNKNQELVDIDIFTKKEKQHLLDVKDLIQSTIFVLNISIVIFIIFMLILFKLDKNFKKDLRSIFMLGGALSFIYLIPIAILAKLQFTSFFSRFHELFFEGNYSFSSTSNLITLYNAQFFQSLALKIFANIAIISILIIFASYSLLKNKKIFKEKKIE